MLWLHLLTCWPSAPHTENLITGSMYQPQDTTLSGCRRTLQHVAPTGHAPRKASCVAVVDSRASSGLDIAEAPWLARWPWLCLDDEVLPGAVLQQTQELMDMTFQV